MSVTANAGSIPTLYFGNSKYDEASSKAQEAFLIQSGINNEMDKINRMLYDILLVKLASRIPADRKSTCLNSSHVSESRMPSSA